MSERPSTTQQQWSAVHEALLAELRWRMAGKDLLVTQEGASDLVDNLADVVVGNFELRPRPPRVGLIERSRRRRDRVNRS